MGTALDPEGAKTRPRFSPASTEPFYPSLLSGLPSTQEEGPGPGHLLPPPQTPTLELSGAPLSTGLDTVISPDIFPACLGGFPASFMYLRARVHRPSQALTPTHLSVSVSLLICLPPPSASSCPRCLPSLCLFFYLSLSGLPFPSVTPFLFLSVCVSQSVWEAVGLSLGICVSISSLSLSLCLSACLSVSMPLARAPEVLRPFSLCLWLSPRWSLRLSVSVSPL